ncbi:PbrT family lead (Pb2+) uptake porter [Boudabousia tangfeifanii]|uniref:PbrT family lead (Pb2+) uptake porter n=1 Tax=Boudabousia tangfeifanii TaxID=1912795 RepID=A0A1D9MLR1_9ACTO|nr:iron uptake system protein EfeO [Boudabousia tangfeifanii]AOZ73215.1 PbrT family lead (Pb2+) uptake porter [Boudabousia tangfeifanii]
MKYTRPITVAVLAAAFALGGCNAVEKNAGSTAGTAETNDGPIQVTITDDSCKVSTDTIPSGTVKFELKNEGTVRNEFEILAEDKLRIVGERENLGPGTTVNYTLNLEPGSYFTACKTNMIGALVGEAKFTVTDSGNASTVSADEQQLRDKAVENYTSYVKDQAGQLVTATKQFTDAYTSGDMDKARSLYAWARSFYERIEPTAEQFGDIDPALDLREADWQEEKDKAASGATAEDNKTVEDPGEWTGWHAIEKDLWRPAGYAGLTPEQAKTMAEKLDADTKRLYDYVYSTDFKVSLDDISNGAIGLLEEVATSKISGEEEAFSHTDLVDFKANVEGAQVAFGDVEPIAKQKDPELAKEIQERFADLNDALDKYKEGDSYKSYDQLDDAARKQLSDKVNALRKPLAQLTEAILK